MSLCTLTLATNSVCLIHHLVFLSGTRGVRAPEYSSTIIETTGAYVAQDFECPNIVRNLPFVFAHLSVRSAMSPPNASRTNHRGDVRALSSGQRLLSNMRAQSEGRRARRRGAYECSFR